MHPGIQKAFPSRVSWQRLRPWARSPKNCGFVLREIQGEVETPCRRSIATARVSKSRTDATATNNGRAVRIYGELVHMYNRGFLTEFVRNFPTEIGRHDLQSRCLIWFFGVTV